MFDWKKMQGAEAWNKGGADGGNTAGWGGKQGGGGGQSGGTPPASQVYCIFESIIRCHKRKGLRKFYHITCFFLHIITCVFMVRAHYRG